LTSERSSDLEEEKNASAFFESVRFEDFLFKYPLFLDLLLKVSDSSDPLRPDGHIFRTGISRKYFSVLAQGDTTCEITLRASAHAKK
jgi:hypothetical protein